MRKYKGAGFYILPLIFLFVSFLSSAPFKWTIAFYMAGDNDLAPMLDEDLEEIRLAKIERDINVVILADRGWFSEHPETYIYVKRDTFLVEVLNLGNLDTGQGATLAFFINYVLSNYPSQGYGLVFWGHGTSWTKGEDPLFRSIAFDATSGHSLQVFDGSLRSVIPDNIFTFVIFDACLMGSIEVLWELENKTRYVLASPALVPVTGLEYSSFLKNLSNFPVDPLNFLTRTCDDYCAYYDSLGRSVIMAVYDLNEIDKARATLKDMVSRSYTSTQDELLKYRLKSMAYSFINPEMWDTMSILVDFGDFSELYVKERANIIKYSRGTGIYANTCGLSIFFPLSYETVRSYYPKYSQLKFQRETDFISLILNTVITTDSILYDTVLAEYPKDLKFLKVNLRSRIIKPTLWSYRLDVMGNSGKTFSVYSAVPYFELKLPPGFYKFELFLVKYPYNFSLCHIPMYPDTLTIKEGETVYYVSLVDTISGARDILGRVRGRKSSGVYIKNGRRYILY
ncbi:MAG: clostripain-related cysteine peptidase [Candidatus Hydrothermia bacterium]